MSYRTFIIAIIIVFLSSISGVFDTINNRIYDSYLIFNQKKGLCSDIVIVEINSQCINRQGHWPWKRYLYAEALKKIIEAKPKVIGIDISFTNPQGKTSEDMQSDKELYDVLKSFSDIVLSLKFNYKKLQLKDKGNSSIEEKALFLPDKSIFPDIKKGHLILGEKDVIRSFVPLKLYPAFSMYVVFLYYQDDPDINLQKGIKNLPARIGWLFEVFKDAEHNYRANEKILIDYQRPPELYKHILFSDILDNSFDPALIKDKIVLLGVTDGYISPVYMTPLAIKKESLQSTSIELQAQIIDSLLNYRGLKKSPLWLTMLYAIALATIFFLITKGKNIFVLGISFLITLIIIFISNYFLFTHAHLWVPPVSSFVLVFMLFGFDIYLTATSVDTNLIKTINDLKEDENVPLTDIPENINDKMVLLQEFMKTISQDRQTIKAIINGVNNGIIVIDQSGKIIWSNARFLDLFKQTLVLNVNINDIMPEFDIEKIKLIQDESQFHKQEISVDNKYFLCFVTAISKQKKQYVIIFNDVTELKEIDRLKTDMIRMVSHELKTPLMNIMFASEEIDAVNTADSIKENNQNIFQYAEVMSNIISDFLNLNKLESDLMIVDISANNIIEDIQRCIEMQEYVLESKNISIAFEHKDIPDVLIDRKLIEIVINNLLSNAIKYSSENSVVAIKLETEDENVRVSVIDQGTGIAKDEIEEIMKKFYRATNNEKNNIQGTGLGLAIVEKILSLHNTSLSIESEENKGSTFSFILACKTKKNQGF